MAAFVISFFIMSIRFFFWIAPWLSSYSAMYLSLASSRSASIFAKYSFAT